jgi:hypothetical protein
VTSRTIIAVGAVAVLLIGISGNACFAETQTPQRKTSQMLVPDRHKCLDLLELERAKVNPQTNDITSDDPQLSADYVAVESWLQGFFTAVNIFAQPDGNVTKGTKPHQWINWVFSYCRAQPSKNLWEAAVELLDALRRDSTTRR